MGDEYEPYQWQVGDPAGYGDDVGVPDYPYMGYLNNGDDEEEERPHTSTTTHEDRLSKQAFKLQKEGRYDEAMDLINQALDVYPNNPRYLNVKAIILDNSGRFEEALVYYDRSLSIRDKSVVRGNKAQCLYRLAKWKNYHETNYKEQLDIINDALATLPDDIDRDLYLHLKGNILEDFGMPIQAKKCHLLASGLLDEIDSIEEKEKILNNSHETFISVAGTKFYKNLLPFKDGVILDLIKEPENEHDHDAIRVEINGETVGYVANSSGTLIDQVKSATEIKNKFDDKTRAKYLFPFLDYMVIAKLI